MKKLFAIFVILAISGCATQPKPIVNPSERIKLNGFSVLPPDENGWFILDKKDSSITFGKQGKEDGEFTTIATASLITFSASVKDEEQFLETVKSLREIYINPEEQQIVSHNEKLAPKIGEYCVKYMIKTEYENDTREKYGLTCRHPKNNEFILDFSVLQKGEDTSDAEIKEPIKTAQKFLPQVQFEELNGVE